MYRGKLFIEDTVRRNHWVSTITIFPWKCYCLGGRGLLLCDKEILCLWQKPLNEETKDRVCLSPHPISHHIYIQENLCLTAQSKIKERGGTEETLVLVLSWLRMTTSPFSASESLLANQCAVIGGEVQESAKQNGHYYARPQCWQLPSSHDDLSINSCNQPYNGLKKSKLFTV